MTVGFVSTQNNVGTMCSQNVNFTNQSSTWTMLTDGQLIIGHTALNAGGTHIDIGVLTSPNSTINIGYSNPNITLDVNQLLFNYTLVTHAMSPYTVNVTTPPLDYYIAVDCSGGAVRLNFPNAPTFKQTWIVKDRAGKSSTNNITLSTPGGALTFDGTTSLVIASNFASVQILANSIPNFEIY